MIFVRLRQQPPARHFDLANVCKGRSGAKNRDVFAHPVPVAHVCHIVLLRSNGRCQLHPVPQSFVVSHIERRPFPRFCPLIEIGDDADLVDDERVRAQVSHFVGNVYVEPIQHGYHGYERRHRQDHSQQCEKSPQLVRAQRIERNAKSLL